MADAVAVRARSRSIPIDRLVGLTEIAERLGVKAGVVWNWTRRYDFPEPITRISNTPVYDWNEVRDWEKDWVRSKGGAPTHRTARRAGRRG